MPDSQTATTIAAVAAGGAVGAVARYGTALGAVAIFPRFPPAGTLVVNVVGCVLIGVLMVFAQAGSISELQRQLWVTGALGALTTFSTFGWQTIELAREHRYQLAVINVVANLLLSLLAVLLGIWLADRLLGE